MEGIPIRMVNVMLIDRKVQIFVSIFGVIGHFTKNKIKIMNNKLWVISLEWNEDTPATDNIPQYQITVYPEVIEELSFLIREQAENYSPYDYLDFEDFTNEKDYRKKVDYLVSKGASITNPEHYDTKV